MKEITIGRRPVGGDTPVFIIAELSCNHRQRFDLAMKTIKAMKAAGADSVKLQTYTPDTITIDSSKKHFKIRQGTLWDGRTLHNLYKEAFTPWDWQPKLKRYAESIGLVCFSSPFDRTAVDFLEKMNVPAYKVASFEITDIPLIEYIASKGKPVIISNGVAKAGEVREALAACRRKGNSRTALLKCTSAYPAPFSDMNLKTIPDMAKKYGCVVGLSDHSSGVSAPVAAVALGAKIIEKHFVLDRKLGGPDASFSLEPSEFALMVKSVREAEAALGKVTYELSARVKKNRMFARSLFVVADIRKGEVFTESNIRSVRPSFGLAPKFLPRVLGRKAARNLAKGTPFKMDFVV